MTLAQNLRQQLNGNKLGLLFLCTLLLAFSSCDMFRKAQTDDVVEEDRTELDEIEGTSIYNPETGQYESSTTITQDVDTVQWVNNPDAAPPITSDKTEEIRPDTGPIGGPDIIDDEPGQKMGTYNVAVMLPFFGNRFSTGGNLDKASGSALNFYGGLRIAMDELKREGVNINLSVHDTKGSEATTSQLMSSGAVSQADMIIGPFRKNNIAVAAEMAKTMRTPFVSPLSASSGVTQNNPYFIQVSPYLPTHCQAITKHVRKRFKTEQVVLVSRNKKAEISRFKYFQDENKEIEGDDDATPFKEYIVNVEGLEFDSIDISDYIVEGDTTVFIVPSFSNKNFIYGLLLRIYITKGNNPVVVYGMPQWMDFDPPSYDYYELLNLHVSSANYLDTEDDRVRNFQRKYFDRYGTIPNSRAYSGYDVMMYFGRMIEKHGTKFQQNIDVEEGEFLHTAFSFVREVPLAAALQEDFSKTNLFENKHVYILKFEDYYFQDAD